jgi:hypothetical protein
MNTTKKLAAELGCTPQAINKAIHKACEAENIDPELFGQRDPHDKRIRTFTPSEVTLILKHAPKPKKSSESSSESILNLAPIVETDAIAPPIPGGLVVRTAAPLMGFNVQTLNVNVLVNSTQALDEQTTGFNQLTAQALGALRQLTKDELQSDIAQMRAQGKHAIAGIQASATVEVVQELIDAQRTTSPEPGQQHGQQHGQTQPEVSHAT